MSQESALKLLKKNKNKWMSTKEISDKLKIKSSSATHNLNKLYISGDIKKKKELKTLRVKRDSRFKKYQNEKVKMRYFVCLWKIRTSTRARHISYKV